MEFVNLCNRLVFANMALHPYYCFQVQLYDLRNDPRELVDVTAAHPGRVRALSRLLRGHIFATEGVTVPMLESMSSDRGDE